MEQLTSQELIDLNLRYKNNPELYAKEIIGLKQTWRLQDELFKACPIAIKEKKHIYIGSGHCFAIGTPILMSDGRVKNIEDIIVGDKVMGDDSAERLVKGIVRGREKMYTVTYYDGTKYTHNESHILSLKAMSTHGKIKKDQRYEYTIEDFIKLNKRTQRRLVGYRTGVEYNKKHLPIDPYIFGVWLGDGCKCSADFCNVDQPIITALKDFAVTLGCELTPRSNKRNYHINPIIRKKENPFLCILKGLGVFNNKHIPHDYLTSDTHQRLELLAGLIDSDGSKSLNGGYEITQKRQFLAEQIVTLSRSLGFFASINKRHIKNTFGEGDYYRVYIGNDKSIPCKIKRKQFVKRAGTKGQKGYRDISHIGIKDISCQGIGDYYGISIDGNQRFLGSDFMVLHNSLGKDYICSLLSLWFLQTYIPSIVIQTAPTDRQVRKVMWGDTLKHWNNKLIDLGGTPYANPYLEVEKADWYLIGFTTKESGASAEGGGKFQGFLYTTR